MEPSAAYPTIFIEMQKKNYQGREKEVTLLISDVDVDIGAQAWAIRSGTALQL